MATLRRYTYIDSSAWGILDEMQSRRNEDGFKEDRTIPENEINVIFAYLEHGLSLIHI